MLSQSLMILNVPVKLGHIQVLLQAVLIVTWKEVLHMRKPLRTIHHQIVIVNVTLIVICHQKCLLHHQENLTLTTLMSISQKESPNWGRRCQHALIQRNWMSLSMMRERPFRKNWTETAKLFMKLLQVIFHNKQPIILRIFLKAILRWINSC